MEEKEYNIKTLDEAMGYFLAGYMLEDTNGNIYSTDEGDFDEDFVRYIDTDTFFEGTNAPNNDIEDISLPLRALD